MEISFILPLLSAIFVLALGFFVLLTSRKEKLNILFTLLCLLLGIWFFGTFMMFRSKTDINAIFWDRIIYIGVVFIPAIVYHFSVVFCKAKKQRNLVRLGYIFSFAFLILSRTDYFISELYKYSWGCHTQARFFHHIFLVMFAGYLGLVFWNLYRHYRKVTTSVERVQTIYVFLAFAIMALVGSLAFFAAYGIGYFPFAYLSGVVFAPILAYAIIKHHLLGIRVILTEALVFTIGFILLVQATLARTLWDIIFRVGIFLLFSYFGYLLIRAVIREIERRREVERLAKELEIANAQLKQFDQAKSDFVSFTSHQLRTPISGIKGYLSMLLEGDFGKLREEQKRIIEMNLEAIERLVRLIDMFLDITRIEAGKLGMIKEKTQLEDLIENVIRQLKNLARRKGLFLRFIRPKTILPKLFVDPDKIREVIINLVDNAIKYTKEGGVMVSTREEQGNIIVQVRDTGMGVPRAEVGKLFEKFSRGKRAYIQPTGSGLGLFVVKQFVEAHGGKAWVESEGEGKGSTFSFSLPIK